MEELKNKLEELNSLLTTMHDGFFIESYDYWNEEILIVGTSDKAYYRDIQIVCKGVVKFFFEEPTFFPKEVKLQLKRGSQEKILKFIEDKEEVSITATSFLYENKMANKTNLV